MKAGWKTVKLGEIAEIYNGNTVSDEDKKRLIASPNAGLAFIATKDVGFDGVINYDNGINIPGDEAGDFKVARKDAVLVCAEGGSAGRKIGHIDRDVHFGNKLFAINASSAVHPRHLYYYCLSEDFRKKFKGMMAGLIGGVSVAKFKQIEIPLPPLVEQKRIVALLDEAFAGIDEAMAKARLNLTNSKDLYQSSLKKIFTSKHWETVKLGTVCKTSSGGTPNKSHKEYYEGGLIPWLRSGEVSQRDIKKSECYITELGMQGSAAKLFPINTVLVAMYGATAGQVGILRFQATTNQAVCGILPCNFAPEFLYYYFLSIKDDLVAQAVGGAQPNISQEKIRATLIPVASNEEQDSIVKELDNIAKCSHEIERICERKSLLYLSLKSSLLSQAFAGELAA